MSPAIAPTTAGNGGRRHRPHQTPLRRSPRLHPHNKDEIFTPLTATATKKSNPKPLISSPPISQQTPSPLHPRRRKDPSLSDGSRPPRRSPRLAAISKGIPALLPDPQVAATPRCRRRSPRLASITSEEPKKGDAKTVEVSKKGGRRNGAAAPKKRRKVEDGNVVVAAEGVGTNDQKRTRTERIEGDGCCGDNGWSKDQEIALRRAYLGARPSPHFWKKVSKMVPGKTAQECFNRVHADCATPPEPRPRLRTNNMNFSPIANFTMSDGKCTEFTGHKKVKRLRSSKKKSLVALRTARHLLQKHCLTDQSQETDLFSVLETSPNALALDLPNIESPTTPNCISNSASANYSGRLSSAHNRRPSRSKSLLKPKYVSPEVLKQIKNIALHEKYIDILHCREAKRRTFSKTSSSLASKNPTSCGELPGVEIARTALISEARDVINHFQHVQANTWNNLDSLNTDDDGVDTDDDGNDDE